MDANEEFEALAHEFYQRTGLLAPGKDDPLPHDREERERRWRAFLSDREPAEPERGRSMVDPTRPCTRCHGTGREPDWKALGWQMRQKRKARGRSLRECATAADISAAYASDLELGNRPWQGEGARRYRKVIG